MYFVVVNSADEINNELNLSRFNNELNNEFDG